MEGSQMKNLMHLGNDYALGQALGYFLGNVHRASLPAGTLAIRSIRHGNVNLLTRLRYGTMFRSSDAQAVLTHT
jgi:hypothetical protein